MLLPAVGLATGVVIGPSLPLQVLAILLSMAGVLVGISSLHRRVVFYPLAVGLLFLALGSLRARQAQELPAHHLVHISDRQLSITGAVVSPARKSKVGHTLVIEADSVRYKNVVRPATGKVWIRVIVQAATKLPKPGQTVRFTGRLRNFPDTATGFGAYLRNRGIYATASTGFVEVVGNAPGLANALRRWRTALGEILAGYFHAPDAAAVAQALVLGIRNEEVRELRQAYAAGGTAHILALSGMHVSILLLLLLQFLGVLQQWGLTVRVQVGLAVGLLVGFAALTGFSASVSRAALMGTLLVLPRAIQRPYAPLNALLAAFTIQLAILPQALLDLGFQLSYAAVLGILLVVPRLRPVVRPRQALVRAAWDVLVVSFAAQLYLLPLTLYHFGSFPTYFLIANLLAAALAYVGTLFSFGVLVFVWLPVAARAFSLPAEWALWLMNRMAEEIAAWPGAVLQAGEIPAWGAALLAACLLLGTFLVRVPNRRWAQPGLIV